ncbi:MAG: Acetyl-CoA decarbonylase/synthase complex subunit delta 1 [Methanosaeta sp. PtaU1.Bin112]|nr:MAG: Acetyl-CoA decarbonylase/synthase complex subunit delta 1 [Methanosaeta sp. PtaU1.Bin112]
MAEEKTSLKMKDINEALSGYQVQSLERVVLEGDIEIEMDLSSGTQPLLAQSLGQELTKLALQLFNFSGAMGYPVDSKVQMAKTGGGAAGK